MTFAHWKNKSVFRLYMDRDALARRVSEAAYKAGIRAGEKKGGQKCLLPINPIDPAAICREIAQRHESSPFEHIGERYRAMGARECEEAVK